MLGEVREERAPVFLEEVGARLRLGLVHLAVLVEPADLVAPRAHRVAGDVRTKSAIAAEKDVVVEELEVVRPGAVGVAHRLDHRTVAVVALVVPRQIHERDGERLLPGGGEHLPERFHLRVVRGGERLHARRARNGPRMLPEVEVVLPLLRGRQHAIHHAHLQVAELVRAGLGVRVDLNGDDTFHIGTECATPPHHAVRHGSVVERAHLRDELHVPRHARFHVDALRRGIFPGERRAVFPRRAERDLLALRHPGRHGFAAPGGQFNCGRRKRHAADRQQYFLHDWHSL